MVVPGPLGRPGGRLVVAQRTEPKTLNWIVAGELGSKEILQWLMADLIHINRQTMMPEPALAKSWKASADKLHWTLELRRGVRFSDGQPFDADDVLFSFAVLMDEKLHSSQRDLFMLEGKPIGVRKLGSYTVEFDLPQPYSVPERLFDGMYILPRRKLESAWKEGHLSEVWPINVAASEIAGLGPFRVKEYVAGQRITLERNPFYWKVDTAGVQLPYLAETTFVFAGSEDAQVLRFEAGESDLIDRLGARNFAALQKESGRRGFDMIDSGPSLEYAFLVFNLGGSPGSDGRRKAWQQVSFRQAVSSAIDRDAMVRVVYLGRASAMESPVPPGNSRWIDKNLPAPSRSATRARGLLAKGGFKWGRDGALLDDAGRAVEFSILISNSNPQRQQMAAMIQEDLRQIGIRVNVTPMEYRSFLDRIQQQHDFDATIVSLQATDADPNPDMALWLSSGANHLWNPRQKQPATAWEAEIDRIMRRQLVTANYAERKKLFDRVQEIAVEYRPLIALVSPNLLAGARKGLGNFRPAPILPYGLANIEQLYWQGIPSAGSVQ